MGERHRRPAERRTRRPGVRLPAATGAVVLAFTVPVFGDLAETRQMLLTGRYDECRAAAADAIDRRVYGEDWRVLKASAELHRGLYAVAADTVETSLQRYSWSIRLRLLGYEAFLHTGQTHRALDMLKEIDRLFASAPWRYSDADDLVALGQTALIIGADPREVLEGFFDRARKENADERDGYLAAGQMALDKHDFDLAGEIFGRAIKRFTDDPDVHFGLARALSSADSERSTLLLQRTLEINPQHVPAMLVQIDRLIDSERYDAAQQRIDDVLRIHKAHPRALAYRAVIAHLQSDPLAEARARSQALSTWSQNPEVDYWIGKKLSQQYRFREGAAHQRWALAYDENYLPARIQLSQDLLRLGDEETGWQLANAAHEADGYDTVTFNLLELRDRIAQFRTLENEHFVVRMDRREAGIYGDRVLRLLGRARETLCAKYGLELEEKITVEIFPDENDFAVRTFGMPAVSGFLGVCFGRVITANSPASQTESPSSWESVLWHEFCHVVTLSLTRNKMPRWLSEGISVYEEGLADPTWAMQMNPTFRQWILDDEMLPVGQLTRAFMSPPSPMHVQFAYFQSSLVVEFLVEKYGIATLREILTDLGNGLPINVALERRTDGLGRLEEDFVEFAQRRARSIAPRVDWEQPDPRALIGEADALREFLAQNPDNYAALTTWARQLIKARQWEQAEAPLRHLIEIYPDDTSSNNAYELLALVYRELGDEEKERQTLTQYMEFSADAVDAFERLAGLHAARQEWDRVLAVTERLLAVNPLLKQPHRLRAEAAEQTQRPAEAAEAWRTLLFLEPEDPAVVHYRLAKQLHLQKDPQARRHVLQALEEAPRFRDAHRLLLQVIAEQDPPGDTQQP